MTTIYLDFDNTMVETNKRVIEILNNRYGENKSEDDLKDYMYHSIHKISEQEKLSIFESDEFYANLCFKPHIIDIISKNYDKFNWVITTKGTKSNLEKKFKWLDKHWPFKMERIGINTSDSNLSKSSVDMSNGIQIDDIRAALDTKATVKILYKNYNNFPWQQVEPGDDVLVVNDWNDIDDILNFYAKIDINTLKERN